MSKLISLMQHMMGVASSTTRGLDAELLEDRVLFSASPVAGAVAVIDEALQTADGLDPLAPVDTAITTTQVGNSNAAETAQSPTTATNQLSAERNKTLELVFIDPATSNYQQLVDDLLASSDDQREFEVYVLNGNTDGVQQISEILEGYSSVDAIHLVSHGDNGAIRLGNTWLNNQSVNSYAGQLALWQSSLTADADILIYGCDVALNPAGQELSEAISALTGADVAASTNDTGHVTVGADWSFEYFVGQVESTGAFSQDLQENWFGKLASITVTTTSDVTNSTDAFISLREAVIQANTDLGEDTIFLGAGTYTLTISGTDDDATAGDLDIIDLDKVTIVGNGASSTIINVVWSNNAFRDRVFHVLAGASLSLQNLTIQGGDATMGFGGSVLSESTLALDHVNISGGQALEGAGIYSMGSLTMTDAEVYNSGSNGTTKGGGIHIATSSSATLTRVNIHHNLALAGAGIYNAGILNYTDGNVSNNASVLTSTGGGIHNHFLGTVHLNRVTVSGNQGSMSAGIFNDENSTLSAQGFMTLTNVTISGNISATNGGFHNTGYAELRNTTVASNIGGQVGGIHNDGDLWIANSIVADNQSTTTNADVEGVFNSLDFNLIENASGSTGFGSNDLIGLAPELGVLSNNGGIAATHRLLTASQAIDAGGSSGAPAVDARGYTRDSNVDIGAFEYRDPSLSTNSQVAINTNTAGVQGTVGEHRGSQQSIAIDGDGNYVVVWTSDSLDGSGTNVFARRFRNDGTALSGEIRVHDQIAGDQKWARVASDESGNFVVTWTSVGQDSLDGSQGVYARRFSASGNALGAEFLVTTTTLGDQSNSAIGMNAAGYFTIVWEGSGIGHPDGIFGRRYSALGTAIDATEFLISSDILRSHADPSVAMNFAGAFVVAWENSTGVRARMYNETGIATSADFGTGGNPTAENPVIALNDNGSFVVAWSDSITGSVHAQLFLPGPTSGTFVASGVTLVNTSTTGTQANPSIAIDSLGNYLVVWEGAGDQPGHSDGAGVFGQRFSSSGSKIGSEFLINLQTSGTQHQASASMLDMNNFVVVWSGEGMMDASGVTARQFGNSAPIIVSNGGAPLAVSVAEGTLAVTTVGAIDADYPLQPLTFSLSGTDASLFTINSSTGALTFLSAPDAQSPLDSGGNNVYNVTVEVSDGVLIDTQDIAITVLPQNIAPSISVPGLQTVSQNSVLAFSSFLSNAITVSDIDGSNVQLSISVTGGTVTLAPGFGSLGLTFSGGDGIADSLFSFQGSLTAVNAALDQCPA